MPERALLKYTRNYSRRIEVSRDNTTHYRTINQGQPKRVGDHPLHKLALIFGKSQTDNCNGYRPASTFPEFLNFKRPCFACLNDLNGAKRLNGWNELNGLRLRERVRFNARNGGGIGRNER